MLKVKIEGYQQAMSVMQQLGTEMQKTILKSALRGAARPMTKAAQQKVPVNTGNLKKMVKTVGFRKVDSPTEVAVAIKHVFGKNKKSGTVNEYYGKWVHEGTAEQRTSRKKGKLLVFRGKDGKTVFTRSVKGIKGKPYIEEAYNQEGSAVELNFGNELQKSVERFVARKFKPINSR